MSERAPPSVALERRAELGGGEPQAAWARRPDELMRAGRRMGQTALALASASVRVRGRVRGELPETRARISGREAATAALATRLCALSGFEVRVRGPLPPPGAPSILMANHVSWQDPLIIAKVAPAVAVAKHELRRWPVVGPLAEGLGTLLVERGCAHSGARVLLRARRILRDGGSVLTFPEGTTSMGGGVLPLHRGMFGVAMELGIPVTPIALRYLHAGAGWIGDATFLPHYIETVGRPRTVAELRLGEPIAPRPGERPEDFAARTREILLGLLRERAPSTLPPSPERSAN